jgi:hypothetical protein
MKMRLSADFKACAQIAISDINFLTNATDHLSTGYGTRGHPSWVMLAAGSQGLSMCFDSE